MKSETMRAALITLSILTILLGIYAGPGSQVIQVPPESLIHQAHRELGELPLPAADMDRLRKLLDQGLAQSRREHKRLSEHLNAVYVAAFILGGVGLFYGIRGGKRKTAGQVAADGDS